jgi:tetratricopeptide (TPR) repeat protein
VNKLLGPGLLLLLLVGGCQPTAVPPERSPHLARAQRAVEAKDFAGAATAYRQLLDQYPQFARGHLELGLLADEKLSDPVTAIYHYRRYSELEPSADKRRVMEDYIERAKLALAAKLPKPEGVDTAELVRLQNQNAALMIEVTGLRARVTELEAKPLPATNVSIAVVAPPPATNVTATVEPPPARPTEHIVAKGDTLYSIALRYYGNRSAWEKIYRANQAALPNRDQLRIGQRLVLP